MQGKAFLRFLASPYFNRQARLHQLASFLLQHTAPSPQEMHAEMYGSTSSFQAQAVYDSLSQLGKLLTRFLAQEQYEADPALQNRYALRGMAMWGTEAAYSRQWKRISPKADKSPLPDLDYYTQQYNLYRDAAELEARLQRRDRDELLQAAVDYLDLSYGVARLKYSCELLNRSHILQVPLAPDAFLALEAWLEALAESPRKMPLLEGYYRIFCALKAPNDEQAYLQWSAWLAENSDQFAQTEAADMYNYAQNYCIRHINQGDSSYLGRLFALFEQLVAKGLVLENGVMDHRKLKNMVTVGIRLKAFAWVDTFLHQYQEQLPERYRQDAYRFNLATLRYAQGQHSEALKWLMQVGFRDVFYELSARSLMLKLYYEMDEDAGLEALVETFRQYVQRNRSISAFQRKVHLNLLRLTRKMHRLRARQTLLQAEAYQRRWQQLATAIDTTEGVANRSWLSEQIQALAPE